MHTVLDNLNLYPDNDVCVEWGREPMNRTCKSRERFFVVFPVSSLLDV
ncbi:hypothetical protein NSP_8420 [Nodularia spumigena CCY9414]|nr:hypothetical protein NSP_8420 [Nodularia spumigena CCY9414]